MICAIFSIFYFLNRIFLCREPLTIGWKRGTYRTVRRVTHCPMKCKSTIRTVLVRTCVDVGFDTLVWLTIVYVHLYVDLFFTVKIFIWQNFLKRYQEDRYKLAWYHLPHWAYYIFKIKWIKQNPCDCLLWWNFRQFGCCQKIACKFKYNFYVWKLIPDLKYR